MSELKLDALTENLDKAIAFVDEHLEEMGCDMRTQISIDVAVEEIFVNVAHYAYTPNVGDVKLIVESEDEKTIGITFIDSGIPFDPLAKPDPDVTLTLEERQVGGLGIFMVKKSMDKVTYERKDDKNILKIIKSFK